MDDADYGSRDRRGHWRPDRPIEYPPVFVWPIRLRAAGRWFFGYPGYLLPWNLLFAAVAIGLWLFATPSTETLSTLAPGWIGYLLVRNLALVAVFYGAFHFALYIRRRQGVSFKFNEKWPATDRAAFLFRDQNRDNVIRTMTSGVPIWTAYEVLTLWAFANGYVPWVSLSAHPIYFVALMLLVPVIRDVHFYLIHRAIHWPPLYRSVHAIHHYNVNPGPWSGLAMHPVEHLLYFSGVLIHWIVPSHPVHALFHLVHAGLSPAAGHMGFDKVVLGRRSLLDTNSFAHYLHHKHFECNYADGVIPLDKWFGTFHDGTEEGHQRMEERRRRARSAG